MSQTRILITGFGPFPGVTENVSGWLAESLAGAAISSRLGCTPEARVLPTQWDHVSASAPRLFARYRPRLILHLGVCRRARGFRIERAAHNCVAAKEDARGVQPEAGTILARGQSRIDTELPVSGLAKHLRKHGVPAVASRSAGAYLCNFLYYHSLDWAMRQEAPCDVCFVHVPLGPAQGGPLSEAELLRGTELILGYLLAHTRLESKRCAPGKNVSPLPVGER